MSPPVAALVFTLAGAGVGAVAGALLAYLTIRGDRR